MNTTAIKKSAIINELQRIPENKLDLVKTFIDSILTENRINPPENRSLKGIWKDAGLEKITDLEGELRAVRNELNEGILKRKF